MPLIERREGQEERIYSDKQALCRAEWARICGVSDYAIKSAIEKSGALIQRGVSKGTSTLTTPVRDFPKVVEGLGKVRRIINGNLIIDRSSGLSVVTPLNSHLVFQAEA